jgi:mediator of RNA polymerase II transcription subunit 7
MAEQAAIAAVFPAPPPFYKHFTKQNLAALRQLRKAAKDSNEEGELDVHSLPAELRYLIPPDPPQDEKYTSFGVEIDRHAPDSSLLASFLSLVGILSANPELYQEKTQDIQTLMYNMHDLINQYRPHQARETLILLMEERVERMRREIRGIEDAKEKVRTVLQTLEREDPAGIERLDEKRAARVDEDAATAGDKRKAAQLQALQAIEDELG